MNTLKTIQVEILLVLLGNHSKNKYVVGVAVWHYLNSGYLRRVRLITQLNFL